MRFPGFLGILGMTVTPMAQDIEVDEDLLFSDTSSLRDSASLVGNASAQAAMESGKSVGISGNILVVGQGGLDRAYFGNPDVAATTLGNSAVGDVALDVRLARGFKAFADLEWSYIPEAAGLGSDSGSAWRIPEMFIDANIRHRLYFRAGKQVLQWGRCYFFNPTDLINVERKSFLRRIGSREGVYGAKAHIPFGTAWNFYGFLDMQGVHRPDSLAGAFRAERLWGRTEMSLMIWERGHGYPVYGADISTRLLGLDVLGEWALHQVSETQTLAFVNGLPQVGVEKSHWASKASLSLGHSFRVSGIQDRLTTVAEYYFNGPGNTHRRLGFMSLLSQLPGAGLTNASALSALEESGVLNAHSYSRNYAAFFATFSRFIRSDITLTFNAIGNINQSCAVISSGIAYQNLNDFGLSFNLNGFVGPEDTEYTLSGQGLQAQIIAEVAF